MQWADVLADASLGNLPYKIELDELGRIVMSPASNRHGILQARLVRLLARLFNEGEILVECSISTHAGVKVADVAWMSAEFNARHGDITPCPAAPELCIEVLSPSNSPAEMTEMIHLYLGYGAREVWTVSEAGDIRLFGPEGERELSCFENLGRPAL
ncbi:MAG: Uma2 family endonuclease [Rhodocyclaceae bacterium]|nr:Uma2 family endonuclease [Rhodocyclaceae bacterium]